MADGTGHGSGWRRPGLAGVLAAVTAVAVTELVAGLAAAGRSIVVAVGDRAIASLPGVVVRFAIEVFGGANRAALLVSMAAVVVAAGWLLGAATARRRWIGPFGLVGFGTVGAVAGLTDPLVPLTGALAAPAVGAAAGTAVLWWLLQAAPRPSAPSPDRPGPAAALEVAADLPTHPQAVMPGRAVGSRRAFLGRAVAVAGTAVVVGVAGRSLQLRAVTDAARRTLHLPRPSDPLSPPPASAALDVDGLTPLLTPNAAFYRIDTALTVPRIDPDTHVVRITGMVDHPVELRYHELLELADTEADVTLACVSNEIGGELVGNARWQGVSLGMLLDRAGVQRGATQIVGRSVDGWTGGFPVEVAFDGRPALVAVGMNGEVLPAAHGFPVRLVVAGLYGYVSDTKWLSEIELTTFEEHEAYWIPRGWAREGPIKTQSRIDVPRDGARLPTGTTPVAGVAWAGERGIAAVEVSIDDGPWQSARLSAELAATSWRQWVVSWPAAPGEHRLRVRATDGLGRTQTDRRSPPAPDGATGHHTITVTVR